MKTKRQNHHRGWKQALSVLLVFALAAGLVLSVPALSGVAYAAPILQDDEEGESNPTADEGSAAGESNRQQITARDDEAGKLNWEKTCSVTVSFPETMTGGTSADLTALQEKGVDADLYLFAPAVPRSGYDVYAYCVDSNMPYYDAVKNYLAEYDNWHTEKPMTTAPTGYTGNQSAGEYLVFHYALEDSNTADIREQERLAELMAKVILVDKAGIEPVSTGAIGTKQEELPAGLYLNVVHGKYAGTDGGYLDPADAVVLAEQTDSRDEAKVCTIAYSDTKVFTFQPQLLSLPTRISFNTLEGDAWYYTLTVEAKGSGADRYADLQIGKTLNGTVNGGTAVFVFHVEATDPQGAAVDLGADEYITLRADGGNGLVSKVIMNKIPVNSKVVITEVYDGAGYRFSEAKVTVRPSSTPQADGTPFEDFLVDNTAHSITIERIPAGTIYLTAPAAEPGGEEKTLPAGTIETAVFTNAPDSSNNGGGSVVNSFAPGANNGWTWTQKSYDPKTGTWNTTNTDTTVTEPALPIEPANPEEEG